MVFRKRLGLAAMVIGLAPSMLSCSHAARLASPKPAVPGPLRRVDGRASALSSRAQANADEVDRLKQGAGVSPSPAVPPSIALPGSERQQAPGAAGTSSSNSSVIIIAQPTPASGTPVAGAPVPADSNNVVDFDRAAGGLRPRAATFIALALVAAILWVARLRHRELSTPR